MKNFLKLFFVLFVLGAGAFFLSTAQAQIIDGPGSNACYFDVDGDEKDKQALACTGSDNKCAWKDGEGDNIRTYPQ